mmetsp:Transcript_117006/g.372425  ORF Transcript_117006/g.372425 Transcript_117006/m.372425 type:complete len:230 (-) Transcript_117006:83-772(-)
MPSRKPPMPAKSSINLKAPMPQHGAPALAPEAKSAVWACNGSNEADLKLSSGSGHGYKSSRSHGISKFGSKTTLPEVSNATSSSGTFDSRASLLMMLVPPPSASTHLCRGRCRRRVHGMQQQSAAPLWVLSFAHARASAARAATAAAVATCRSSGAGNSRARRAPGLSSRGSGTCTPFRLTPPDAATQRVISAPQRGVNSLSALSATATSAFGTSSAATTGTWPPPRSP